MNELISVIVPVYNVDNFMRKCIESIRNQTYKNIEIILVDDGSTDNSGKICDEYAEIDQRIKVIHKKNGGLSDARNYGIRMAHGRYIGFVDSDDYIKNDMYEYLYNLIINEQADISICNFVRCAENEIIENDNDESVEVFDNKLATEYLLKGIKMQNFPWNKLYKKELFEDISYPYGKTMEDLGTTYKLFLKCNKIAVGNMIKYYYIKRNGSILNSKSSAVHIDGYELAYERYKFIQQNYPEIKSNEFAILNKILTLYSVPFEEIKKYLNNNNILEIANDVYANAKKKKSYITNNIKIRLTILKISPKIYRLIFAGRLSKEFSILRLKKWK